MHFVASGCIPCLQAGHVFVGGGGACFTNAFVIRNTITAMIRKSTTTPMKWPYVQLNRQNPKVRDRQFPEGVSTPTMGITRSPTIAVTTSFTALPITTPMARANMFDLSRNSRNSCAYFLGSTLGTKALM